MQTFPFHIEHRKAYKKQNANSLIKMNAKNELVPNITPFTQLLPTRVCFTSAGINNNNIYIRWGKKVLSIYFL